MAVTIAVEDGESIDLTLRKLSKKVKSEMGRCWHKRRFGYYEKASLLKRTSKKTNKLAIASGGALWLTIGLQEQFSRNGNSAVGR